MEYGGEWGVHYAERRCEEGSPTSCLGGYTDSYVAADAQVYIRQGFFQDGKQGRGARADGKDLSGHVSEIRFLIDFICPMSCFPSGHTARSVGSSAVFSLIFKMLHNLCGTYNKHYKPHFDQRERLTRVLHYRLITCYKPTFHKNLKTN